MKIYHGSQNSFKEFDYSKIRTNATTEGVGFYCTNNIEVANKYCYKGYIMEYNYIGKKTLNSKGLSLTRQELKSYLRTLNEECEFLSNFGDTDWEGIENVLNKAIRNLLEYSRDDVELISSLCNVCGEFESPLKILYKVLGYDSAIVDANWGNQKIYLILHNSAIEYVSTTKYKEVC